MEWMDLILRYAHVLLALLWTALAMMVVLLVGPSLQALAPPERKAMQLQLIPRQLAFATLASLGTLLTGFALMHQLYLGPTGLGLLSSDRGKWLLAGAVLALVAFTMALAVIMPTAKRIEDALKGEGDPSQLPALGGKMAKIGRAILMHQLESLVCMLLAAHPLLSFSLVNLVGAILTAAALGYGLVLMAAKAGPKA